MVGLAMQVDGFPMQVLDETGKTYRIGAHDFTVHIHNSKADGYHNFRITFVDKDGIDQDMRVGFELKKQVPIARDRHVPADSAAMKNALTQIEQMDPNAGEAMLDDKPARARRHGRKQGPPTARGH